jgi:hypothetical protein
MDVFNEEIDSYVFDHRTISPPTAINLEPNLDQNNEPKVARPKEGRQNVQVARRTPPYRPCMVAHGFAWRSFTPPYPKGGA